MTFIYIMHITLNFPVSMVTVRCFALDILMASVGQ
jgi:hypothetical protein